MVLGQYGAILVGSWLYWVSTGRHCLVLGYIGSVWGGTGWYLVALGQKKAVMVSAWYWVSVGLIYYCFQCHLNSNGVEHFYLHIFSPFLFLLMGWESLSPYFLSFSLSPDDLCTCRRKTQRGPTLMTDRFRLCLCTESKSFAEESISE